MDSRESRIESIKRQSAPPSLHRSNAKENQNIIPQASPSFPSNKAPSIELHRRHHYIQSLPLRVCSSMFSPQHAPGWPLSLWRQGRSDKSAALPAESLSIRVAHCTSDRWSTDRPHVSKLLYYVGRIKLAANDAGAMRRIHAITDAYWHLYF